MSLLKQFSNEHLSTLHELKERKNIILERLSKPLRGNEDGVHREKLKTSLRLVEKDISLLHNHYKVINVVESIQATLKDIYADARKSEGVLTNDQIRILKSLQSVRLPILLEMINDDANFFKEPHSNRFPRKIGSNLYSIVNELLEFALGVTATPSEPLENKEETEKVRKPRKPSSPGLSLDAMIAIRSGHAEGIRVNQLAKTYAVCKVKIYEVLHNADIDGGYHFKRHIRPPFGRIEQLSEEQIKSIRSEYSKGATVKQLAEQYKVSTVCLYRILRKKDLGDEYVFIRKGNAQLIRMEDQLKIRAAYGSEHFNLYELASQYKVSQQTIVNVLRRRNIDDGCHYQSPKERVEIVKAQHGKEIFHDYETGERTIKELAVFHNVNKATIVRVINRQKALTANTINNGQTT